LAKAISMSSCGEINLGRGGDTAMTLCSIMRGRACVGSFANGKAARLVTGGLASPSD